MTIIDETVDDVRVLVWRIEEDYESLLALHPCPDSIDKEVKGRFRSKSRQLEWLAARVLLCRALGKYVTIMYDDDGAPLLPDAENMNISISHTLHRQGEQLNGYVAIILSGMHRVGIDIEMISEKVDRVKSRFVREDEHSVSNISNMIHWSAKETLFKLLRHEGADFLKDMFIHPFQEQNEGVIYADEYISGKTIPVKYWVYDDFVMTASADHIP